MVQIGAKPNRIDLITSISGVSFEDAWANKTAGMGRPKDLGDAGALKKREPKA